MTYPHLSNNKTIRILDAARAGGYAVPALCTYNFEGVLATIRAAEAQQSPAMVLFFPWVMEYSGATLIRAAADACRSASVPVSLHLDHCQTPELVRRAADIAGGFDSIMCDMSHYERDESLALTRELTEYCHARGITTEAEPGRIEGGEDGVAETVDLEGVLTTPEEALEFVDLGIELLAPAFGNVHGEYGPRGIQLEYERLRSIKEAVGDRVHLVLHGADPFDEEIFGICIEAGVTKVNINRGMNDQYVRIQKEMEGKPLTTIIEKATDAMQGAVEKYMKWLGSAGKAQTLEALSQL
ncbi:unnamed protein product [Parascedosporium putredinis]|uniref:Fructose-bisphosphate aldolase n=1 Tax=Parascedosporium putredinis TaxID=1442378 RepID=A0A9P1HC29_9PEZI|nr:unnamed protein product [Parascedosporium putredinis]CAI8004330.1 unnamed protein product [Parascedosporium putredinis]